MRLCEKWCILRVFPFNILKKIKISSTYITAPWGVPEQSHYLNFAVTGDSDLDPHQLLELCAQIEHKNHRKRSIRNGPRTLDIDILLYDDRTIDTPKLTIPHPGLCQRDFMLIPLLEIAPLLIHPIDQQPLTDYIHSLTIQQILATESNEWLFRGQV